MKKFKNVLLMVLICSLFSLIGLLCACSPKDSPIFYDVVYTANEGGYISGETTQVIERDGDACAVVAIAYDGYEFLEWSDGVTTATRIDENITNDITVTAKFEKLTYTVNYATDGNGKLQGETNQTVKFGENATTVKAVPSTGYRFVKWSDGVTEATRQDKNVTENISFTAIFEKQTYTLSYVASEGGYLNGATNQTISHGESGTTITAIPNKGYNFVEWSDGVTTAERQDKDIIADKTITAIFEKIKFTVTYNVSIGGTIDGNAIQEIEYGEDAEFVIAVPDTGYIFVKWSDGYGSTIRQEYYVTSTINLTAEFEFLYNDGEGTQLNPFTISNYVQLNNIWYYPEANYKLINDLDLSGIKHEPIFDKVNFFKGNFNGGGYTVKNLTVETELNYLSLFGVVGGGSISNLNISNAVIITTDYDTWDWQDKYYVGILAGMVKGYIHDINVSGEIKVNGLSYPGVAIGGITGYVNGTVANCLCTVQMEVKHAYTTSVNYPFVFGGMIGVSQSAFIRDCNAEGQINITECDWTESGSSGDLNKHSDILAGGMVGYCFTDRQVNAYIRDCRTDVKIYGDNHYNAGGFVGYLDAGQDTTLQITDCSVYGGVTCGIVGGFVYKAYNSSNSTLLFEKCIIENNITAFNYGVGFVYFCQATPNGIFQIINCYTKGNIRTCSFFDSERVVGRAAGFGWQMSYITIINCYSKRDINSGDGRGFAFYMTHGKISSCFYEGTIDISNSAGSLRGVGMFDSVTSSTLENLYVRVNFVTGEKNTSNLYALIRLGLGGGKINNVYCYGNYCKISESNYLQNITNGHFFKANIEESNLPQEGDETDIAIYESAEDMYFLADKLNEGQEEVFVNVENGLPKLKFEIE